MRLLPLLFAATALPVAAWGQFTPLPPPTPGAATATTTNSIPTTVNSDALDADLASRKATFRGNVIVKDASFFMKSDEMVVAFNNEANGVDEIRAKGSVLIEQVDKTATAAEAIYFVKEAKILLNGSPESGDPKVISGGNTLTGKSITFFRNDNRVLVDGKTILTLQNTGALGTFTPKPQAPTASKSQTPASSGTNSPLPQ